LDLITSDCLAAKRDGGLFVWEVKRATFLFINPQDLDKPGGLFLEKTVVIKHWTSSYLPSHYKS
jgi:hypothetical protein